MLGVRGHLGLHFLFDNFFLENPSDGDMELQSLDQMGCLKTNHKMFNLGPSDKFLFFWVPEKYKLKLLCYNSSNTLPSDIVFLISKSKLG